MGGVNCIQTFLGFLDFFYIYKVPKSEEDLYTGSGAPRHLSWHQITINPEVFGDRCQRVY